MINQLGDSSGVKRRAAAKQLRKLRDQNSCGALETALRTEIQDPRTWETQYQLIMAIAHCGCAASLPFLRALADEEFYSTMRLVALGDAIVRLGRTHEIDAEPVFEMLDLAKRNDPAAAGGALRAVAMLRLRLNDCDVDRIISEVEQMANDPVTFWAAAAAAGWSTPKTELFLQNCRSNSLEDTRIVAGLSLRGQYGDYRTIL